MVSETEITPEGYSFPQTPTEVDTSLRTSQLQTTSLFSSVPLP